MFFDPLYLVIALPGLLFSLWASFKTKTTFNKYSKFYSANHVSGAEAAARLLNYAGIYDVRIQRVAGDLTDHYDPRNKTLNLSETVYGSASVAAVGVAAHECGHAIQHDRGYVPLRFRSAIVPVANFGSQISWPLILIGLLLGGSNVLIQLGILCFSMAVLFQLVTLPVEFNASSRAVKLLSETGIL